ncbi:MAG: hypothetical protein EA362_06310 [Saprospirales bacterium]|nr:MAG: hypothetical protein EA362_06310 [Saprospirales bacterium]
MIYIAIIIALSFVAITLGISGFTKYIRPGLNQMKKDVLRLRSASISAAANLIPLKHDEIELLSSRVDLKSLGNRFRKTKSGFLNSIYNEPMVAFTIKRYLGNNRRKIIYARTTTDEFVFIQKKNTVQLYLNGNPFGKLENDNLYFLKDNKRIAWIEGDRGQSRPLYTPNKKLALINPNIQLNDSSSRTFQFVGDLNPSEQKILLSVVVFKLLENE